MSNPAKILLLLLLFAVTDLKAQEFGGNPPSIKWKQVNTPAAKVIFPAGLDSAGMRVANIVQQMNGPIQPTIGYKQKQVSIVLQNQTTIANAYVGLAPFRSEFYLTPNQNSFDIGSLPWNEQLAIHEFRHVQQYNNFNVGLSRVLHTVFGEGGQALAYNLAIPNWFFEGDAVFNETHVSEQGRGRLPYFLNGYRALWDADRNYSWMKLRNGSYLDYTPDWYPLGYMMVAYGREKYGDTFWKDVTHDAAAYKGLFYPMQKAIGKYSGVDFEQFRGDALNHFERIYADDISNKPADNQHFIADLEYPAYVNDHTLIYMKSTYDHLPQFIINTDGREKSIAVRSVSLDNYFAYHDGKIVYAAYRPDLRWTYRDYSELQILDVKTGTERHLTKRSKYFSPSFSDDGKSIVAVLVNPSGVNDLHILSASTGHIISVVPNLHHLFFTYPKFYGADRLVSAVRDTKGRMSLAIVNIKTGRTDYLLPFTFQPIAFPFVQGDMVYFSATSGLNDRLFAIAIKAGKLYQVDHTAGEVNQYEPAVSGNKLTWVEFTAFGYKLCQGNVKLIAITDNKLPGTLPGFNISALQRDASTNLLAYITNKPMKVTDYSKSYHLFNFHSLVPDFNDPNYTFSLLGENVLNTFQSQLSFNYNRDEGYKQLGFDAIYGSLFPFISVGADYTFDRRSYYKGNNVFWNESDVHAGLELPLNLSSGKQLTGLAIGSDVYYSNSVFEQAYRSLFNDRSYTYLNNYITFSNNIQQAKQNIYPRFGQTLSLNYKTAVSGLNANQFLASGTFYFPGLFINHNLVINAAHQQRGEDNVIDFSNDFPFSRGYTAENLYNMNKVGLNYHFPIVYPDKGVANTIYFLRIRGNLFFDYTRANDFYTNGTAFKANFRSTGAEIYFDTQWFNQQPLTFGIRYSYLLDNDIFGGNGPNRIEFVLPVSFY
jgi:hypothetical protein